uniref:Uncharacterized protein n=1 Tax=Canis lupus dingo TaxID=286419 RepID=A0A8C0K3U7_CANLU
MRNSAYIFDDVKLQRRVPQHFCELCRKSTLRSALGQQGHWHTVTRLWDPCQGRVLLPGAP